MQRVIGVAAIAEVCPTSARGSSGVRRWIPIASHTVDADAFGVGECQEAPLACTTSRTAQNLHVSSGRLTTCRADVDQPSVEPGRRTGRNSRGPGVRLEDLHGPVGGGTGRKMPMKRTRVTPTVETFCTSNEPHTSVSVDSTR